MTIATALNAEILSAVDRTARRVEAQNHTIARLDGMTEVDWIVNAEAVETTDGVQVWTTSTCGTDSAHGLGTVAVPDVDELQCPECAERLVRPMLVDNARIDLDVLL
jgi:hypothetical protein